MTRTIGFVGCAGNKLLIPARAEDLYTPSPLFRGRRSYVEGSCDEWWVLSAQHGLVHPQTVLTPYDTTLKGQSRSARREWAQSVLAEIRTRIGPTYGDVAQIHAGSDYRDFGLTDGLSDLGCQIENPTHHMAIGEQLRFYKEARLR